MSNQDVDSSSKLKRFNGNHYENYNLWRIRAKATLKGKQYWSQLMTRTAEATVLEKATSLLVSALGDSPLRVWRAEIGNPIELLNKLDQRYTSNRAASRIATSTAVYSKHYSDSMNTSKYIDEFSQLFSQLEMMGDSAMLPEAHKAPILLASLGTSSRLENTAAALRLKDLDDLTWESVTTDLIQEYERRTTVMERHERKNAKPHRGSLKKSLHKSNKVTPASQKDVECTFYGKKGHEAINCFLNPASPNCKLKPSARANIQSASKGLEKSSSKPAARFGGFAGHIQSVSALGTRRCLSAITHKVYRACLDSGASCTMFCSPVETVQGTY